MGTSIVASRETTVSNNCQELYLNLLKDCLTASLYEESSWSILQGPMKTENGPYAWAARMVVSAFRRFNIRLVRTNTDLSKRESGNDWPLFGMTMVGRRRINNVQFCVEQVLSENIPGDFVETGVWRGGTCILAKAIFKFHDSDRSVWCCDSFEGMPVPSAKDLSISDNADFSDREHLRASKEMVEENFRKFDLLDAKVHFLKGWFSETLPNAPIETIAILRLDGDLYDSTMDALENLYDKVSIGGYVIVDDYLSWPGCKMAVDDFRNRSKICSPLTRIDDDAVFWRKGDQLPPVVFSVAKAM